MNADKLFAATGDSYLSLVHLEDGADESVLKISRTCATCSPALIDVLLIDGPSWRERITGIVMASSRGIANHYESLIKGFCNSGGVSIVPLTAAISVAARDFGCDYSPALTDSLDRTAWDGEIGFALDWLHHAIGMGDEPESEVGPNYGQNFKQHLEFYSALSGGR